MDERRGKVVIVTGSSRGLGRAIALQCGSAGWDVVVTYKEKKEEAEQVVREIVSNRGQAFSLRCDVRIPDDVSRMVDETVARWGRVDLLINNAGIARDTVLIAEREEEWDDLLGTNLTGAFHCIRTVGPVMIQQGGGQIINIASLSGITGRKGLASYSASKAGIIGLTKAMAKEWGPFNIRVNAICPGYLPTQMGQGHEELTEENVLQRTSTLEEVSGFVCHLASMTHVSGQVFNLDSRIF